MSLRSAVNRKEVPHELSCQHGPTRAKRCRASGDETSSSMAKILAILSLCHSSIRDTSSSIVVSGQEGTSRLCHDSGVRHIDPVPNSTTTCRYKDSIASRHECSLPKSVGGTSRNNRCEADPVLLASGLGMQTGEAGCSGH
jgi:hypothetical protein